MDVRRPLDKGYILSLGSTDYNIEAVLGFGSNSFVYTALYGDNLNADKTHRVLIKELFPYHPDGLIQRGDDGVILTAPQAQDFFDFGRASFIRGNSCHLDILDARPDMASANINSYEKNNTLYTVMGDLGGRTLLAKAGAGSVTLRRAVLITLGILNALDCFHKNGLLHLDVSPDNIIMLPDAKEDEELTGRILLIDYNSAINKSDLREPGRVFFSVKDGYTAPEVRLKEPGSISEASDLFSVCAIFLELLRGRPLEQAELYNGQKLLTDDAALLRGAPPTAVFKARQIVHKGLRLSPGQRYTDTSQLRRELSELLARIDGMGVTHASLWEASRQNYIAGVRKSGRFAYLFDKNERFELSLRSAERVYEGTDSFIRGELAGRNAVQITGDGGIGKTTVLTSVWGCMLAKYDPGAPVPIFISLCSYTRGERDFLRKCMLERLKFDSSTSDIPAAMHALDLIMNDKSKSGAPRILLLLDGLNEVSADPSSLIAEITAAAKCEGVSVVLTSRKKTELKGFLDLKILPLTEGQIRSRLQSEGLAYPAGSGTAALLTNPLMLAVYAGACIAEGRPIDTDDPDELMGLYIKSLTDSFNDSHPGAEDIQAFASFAVNVFLPSAAALMGGSDGGSVSTSALYGLIGRSFKLIDRRRFIKAFPEYAGKAAALRNGAATPDAWFDLIVTDMLCKRMGLLYRSQDKRYRLIHRNFSGCLSQKYKKNRAALTRATVFYRLPRMLIAFLCAGLIVFGSVKIYEKKADIYPRTTEQVNINNNAMEALGRSIQMLGLQFENDKELLDIASNGSYDDFLDRYASLSVKNDNAELDELYDDENAAALMPDDSPIPEFSFMQLLNSPNVYRTRSRESFALLASKLAPGSGVDDEKKAKLIKYYSELTDELIANYYILLQFTVLPVKSSARQKLYDRLTQAYVFADKFTSTPFVNDKTQLNSSLAAIGSQINTTLASLSDLGASTSFYDYTGSDVGNAAESLYPLLMGINKRCYVYQKVLDALEDYAGSPSDSTLAALDHTVINSMLTISALGTVKDSISPECRSSLSAQGFASTRYSDLFENEASERSAMMNDLYLILVYANQSDDRTAFLSSLHGLYSEEHSVDSQIRYLYINEIFCAFTGSEAAVLYLRDTLLPSLSYMMPQSLLWADQSGTIERDLSDLYERESGIMSDLAGLMGNNSLSKDQIPDMTVLLKKAGASQAAAETIAEYMTNYKQVSIESDGSGESSPQ